MIKNIIELLPYVKGETENIRIAKGKYKHPESIKEVYQQFKKDLKNLKQK
mgnify:CR=1 FL=1|jgi:hypothetical protein|tara:strand:+ start:217 stop:366 length:150 start_codon:yes stop_codon:yes gene_type:complete